MSTTKHTPWPPRMGEGEFDLASVDAADVRRAFCMLQAWAYGHTEGSPAADCFCEEAGFWNVDDYDGSAGRGYRNEGVAFNWIRDRAVALAGVEDPAAFIESVGRLVESARALLRHPESETREYQTFHPARVQSLRAALLQFKDKP